MFDVHHPQLTSEGYWKTQTPHPRMIIFTGAGLSKDSGLDTFRDNEGLWENHSIDEVCNGRTWRLHRDKIERFYQQRLEACRAALPHDGHRWCAQMEENGAVLITQNVDNLLERAGAQYPIHLHGRIDERACWACSNVWSQALFPGASCPLCGSDDTRVNVVFFHEPAPMYGPASSAVAGLRSHDVLVIVGTTAKVVNPLRWLTGPCHIWVVDPQPSPLLVHRPHTTVFAQPAKELGQCLTQAWHDHLKEKGARG